mmetsp:Transcript_35217/g.78380  ORF Transcript_35217/g.78380 Transcript_35217/m.78380 type:complete len:493 (-) Transcript_35217:1439-2917(-)|eukprot:CAMPEP_0202891640 /NCGR_PEP_ID=MMETSP1392-20130828/1648_1 /ASSEMBLY_ACC=CAM_ASM_000868 /TAXON_ID=225041 /ORGANISM="Chlamydomonas chlamydogama, Strain SAG 11-48b" /LENGTH=492 /DNA_ID=CAMNT_0049575455 /DNA_START=158 /DNA_END=1636 /DNA_ORIENTATION=+
MAHELADEDLAELDPEDLLREVNDQAEAEARLLAAVEINYVDGVLVMRNAAMDEDVNAGQDVVLEDIVAGPSDDQIAADEDGPLAADTDTIDSFTDDEEDDSSDTTAEQVHQGRDIQGIPWDRLHFTREHYRQTRLRQYRNYTNVLPEDTNLYRDEILKACKPETTKGGRYYDFVRNSRAVQSNIVHFQLRNLVWATSRNDVFVTHENCISHWNPVTCKVTEVINLAGNTRCNRMQGISRVQISTLCVKEGIVAAGGFGGELVCRRLDSSALLYSGRVTHSENGITNGIEIFSSLQHGPCIMTSNNDAMLRVFSAETFKPITRVQYPWAVNYATMRPDSHLAAVVGDHTVTHLTDINSGATVAQLTAHRDFSFAAAWHPNGNMLATGNQDTTSVVWDIRHTSSPLAVLPGCMGAIRSLRFSSDGRYLAMAEPADFVHIYDVQSGFTQYQEVDLFGEIAGISFSPLADCFFIGISDMTYSSLIEFERWHPQQM